MNNTSEENFYVSDSKSLSNIFEFDDDDLINDELECNLTKEQVEAIQKELEDELKKCLENQGILKEEKDALELKLVKGPIEEERLEVKKQLLREEEANAEQLMVRIAQLKSRLIRPGAKFESSFPVSRLPQVILCGSWDDDLMPKVVVCNKPKQLKLHPFFSQCFTPEQMAIIAQEKRWMAFECGQLQVQIANLKGQVRVISKENDSLKAIVEEDDGSRLEEGKSVKLRLPCYENDGYDEAAKPCPKYQKRKPNLQPTSPRLPELTVSVSSVQAGVDNMVNPVPIDIGREVDNLKKTVDNLQQRLNEAKDKSFSVGVKEAAIRCVVAGLKNCE